MARSSSRRASTVLPLAAASHPVQKRSQSRYTRVMSFGRYVSRFAWVLSLLAVGCPKTDGGGAVPWNRAGSDAPDRAGAGGGGGGWPSETRDAGVDAATGSGTGSGLETPIASADVLFVVDNSGSMRQEQAALREQFPRLIEALTTGRKRNGESFSAVKDMHLGVVSTDMGLSGIANNFPGCNT